MLLVSQFAAEYGISARPLVCRIQSSPPVYLKALKQRDNHLVFKKASSQVNRIHIPSVIKIYQVLQVASRIYQVFQVAETYQAL